MCRDCCCGSSRKHPDVDHAGQVSALRAAAGRSGDVRVSDCLDVCDQSNVVVVQPSAEGRRRGGRPTWLGLVNDESSLADVAAWIGAGGPGIAPIPGPLELNVIRPPKGAR
jgi:(2Fe-2S) ferredoxin